MQAINALTLTADVNDWLANSRRPRILHVFGQACNLINERGHVLSIVTPQIGKGPFNLVVEEDICFSDYLYLEFPVSLFPTQLTLGSLTIDTAAATLWSPRPDWENLYTRKDTIAIQLAKFPITNDRMRGLQSLISDLSSCLAVADVRSSLLTVQKLAGLGNGLTPAGDDIILGALYAVWIIHPAMVASVLAQKIADTAAPLTTSLSAAWLRAAGRAEAGILWHQFFEALIMAHPMRIEEARKKILAVGETSGADALAGFSSVFASWMEK